MATSLIGVLSFVLFGVGSPAGAATASPPTLTGEILTASAFGTAERSILGACNANPDGTTTLTLTATGTASGPYNGTFTETITATIGAQTGPVVPQGDGQGTFGQSSGVVTDASATFTIHSATGTVTGTKSFDVAGAVLDLPTADPVAANRGACIDFDATEAPSPFPAGFLLYGYYRIFDVASLSYDATIVTDDGSWHDEGRARAIAQNACIGDSASAACDESSAQVSNVNMFNEWFESNLAVTSPLPRTPNSKDDCKGGGWTTMTDSTGQHFKNQGDCVSFAVSAHSHGVSRSQ